TRRGAVATRRTCVRVRLGKVVRGGSRKIGRRERPAATGTSPSPAAAGRGTPDAPKLSGGRLVRRRPRVHPGGVIRSLRERGTDDSGSRGRTGIPFRALRRI